MEEFSVWQEVKKMPWQEVTLTLIAAGCSYFVVEVLFTLAW